MSSPSMDLVELVADLQSQLSLRGVGSFRTLELAFIVNDRDGNGTFDFGEVESILAKAGLFLKRQNLTKLYRYFDKNQNERVYFPDLLDAIRGTLTPRRLNMLNEVFDMLDSTGHGSVDGEKIIRTFNPSRHPQVLSGQKKPNDLVREFVTAFDGAGASNNGAVTRAEFIKFYHGISAATPYDDEYFINVLERVWNVKEQIPASLRSSVIPPTGRSTSTASASSFTRTPLLARVRDIFREKIRQKTRNTKSEVENLRLVLQHFDLSNSGYMDFPTFQKAVERFGIYLDQQTLIALFNEFDNGDSRMDYLAFATALYDEDTTSAAYHQFQRSQSLKMSQRLHEEQNRPESRREYIDANNVLISSPPVASSLNNPSATSTFRTTLPRRTLSQKERENSVLPTVIFFFGGPSVGVNTQASRVVREFGFVQLSLPLLAKSEMSNKSSAIGKQLVTVSQRQGGLFTIPSEIALELLKKSIQENFTKGSLYFIVSGFPSSLADRELWDSHMSSQCETPFAIYFESSQLVMEKRYEAKSLQAGLNPNRNELKKRFEIFANQTIPVINSYGAEGRLQVVDASGTPDGVTQQVQKIIAEL